MTLLTEAHVELNDRIIETMVSKSSCPKCGHRMDVSVFVSLDSDCPLDLSWVCWSCSRLEDATVGRDYSVMVPGMSRSERLDNILYIAESLIKYTPGTLTALNCLLKIAAVEGIRISYLDLVATSNVRSAYFNRGGLSYILLDNGLRESQTEHVQVLAEEVGRYFAHKLENKNGATLETTALRWAIRFLSSTLGFPHGGEMTAE